MKTQTRTVNGDLKYYDKLDVALTAAFKNKEVWKISFDAADGTRVRMIRTEDGWVFENIDGERFV